MRIVKRDGTEQDFNKEKIARAVRLANGTVDTSLRLNDIQIKGIVEKVSDSLKGKEKAGVEDVQDLVEKELVAANCYEISKSFILYREKRTVARNKKSDVRKRVRAKIFGMNNEMSNANVDELSFGGREGEANSEQLKEFALEECMSEMAKKNHLNNMIYIHDLNSYAVGKHNCLSVPFDDLLRDGFNTRQTDVRPANSINTAFQLVAVIFQLQSLQQFGGCSATHLDWTMVPYVRKSFYKHYKDGLKYTFHTRFSELELDKESIPNTSIDSKVYRNKKAKKYAMDMTLRELNQAVEGMYHNLNTLQSRSGNQLPFTSINYGTCALTEGRMVIKSLLETSLKGVGKFHKTPIFPCGIFQYMKGVNDREGTPNYDMYQLAIKSTTKRLYPNYCNVDWSGNEGYDISDPRTYMSTMGCRTANGYDINGFGQMKDGRGNICPVTIILPVIAILAKQRVEKKGGDIESVFIEILDRKITEAKDMLLERFEWICSQPPESAKFMWENGVMKGYVPEEGVRSAMKHGTLAIGQIGLAETLQILIKEDHTTEKGMNLAVRIESLFKQRCMEFKENHKLNFGVYYTPAESLCGTAMSKFKKKYGVIENVSDHDFFTNSIHVPVWKQMSPFEKIDIESQLTGYSSAGCITYVELDSNAQNNTKAVEQIVNYAMKKDIPYFAINVPSDTCLDCGYQGQIDNACPVCKAVDCGNGDHIQRLRRVTGYLTGNYLTAFNMAKQAEVKARIKHSESLNDWNRIV